MPVEREDQEPNEKLPPGYRNMTPSEREKLKQALSDRSEWESKERDKIWRGLEATFKIRDSRARDVQLDKIEQRLSEMEKWKSDVDEMRAKWFRLGALADILPILIVMLYV